MIPYKTNIYSLPVVAVRQLPRNSDRPKSLQALRKAKQRWQEKAWQFIQAAEDEDPVRTARIGVSMARIEYRYPSIYDDSPEGYMQRLAIVYNLIDTLFEGIRSCGKYPQLTVRRTVFNSLCRDLEKADQYSKKLGTLSIKIMDRKGMIYNWERTPFTQRFYQRTSDRHQVKRSVELRIVR